VSEQETSFIVVNISFVLVMVMAKTKWFVFESAFSCVSVLGRNPDPARQPMLKSEVKDKDTQCDLKIKGLND
jgi:hypothetical protein